MLTLNSDFKKSFLIALGLGLAYIAPVIFSVGYYLDDLGRSLWGYTSWSGNARPLADLVMTVLNFGKPLQDISPIPQILAVAALAFAIAAACAKFLPGRPFLGVLAFSPLITSPFFLENLSYKYDSLPMALAVTCAALPFTYNIERLALRWLTLGGSLLMALCLYQPAINIYVCFAILSFLFFVYRQKRREAFIFLALAISAFLIAYAIYAVLVVPLTLDGTYSEAHATIVSGSFEHMSSMVARNFGWAKALVWKLYDSAFLYIVLPFMAAYLFLNYRLAFRRTAGNISWDLGVFIILLLSPALLLLCIAGPILLLEEPVVVPRVLVGHSAVLATFFVATLWLIPKKLDALKYSIIVPLWFAFIFDYTYANAMAAQNRFERMIVTSMVEDIMSDDMRGAEYLTFHGTMPIAPEAQLAKHKFPLIEDLNQIPFRGNWYWGYVKMRHFGIQLEHDYMTEEEIVSTACSAEYDKQGLFHTLYRHQENLVISFLPIDCN